jgi:hypothetical protein
MLLEKTMINSKETELAHSLPPEILKGLCFNCDHRTDCTWKEERKFNCEHFR